MSGQEQQQSSPWGISRVASQMLAYARYNGRTEIDMLASILAGHAQLDSTSTMPSSTAMHEPLLFTLDATLKILLASGFALHYHQMGQPRLPLGCPKLYSYAKGLPSLYQH